MFVFAASNNKKKKKLSILLIDYDVFGLKIPWKIWQLSSPWIWKGVSATL